MDDKKKKKYVIPEAEILDFANDDIITLSGDDEASWGDGAEWWVD